MARAVAANDTVTTTTTTPSVVASYYVDKLLGRNCSGSDPASDSSLILARLFYTLIFILLWTTVPLLLSHWKRRHLLLHGGIPHLASQPEGWSWPFFGQAINYLKYRPWDLMMKWHRVHGPIFSFDMFGSLFVSVASPTLLKQVLQSKIGAVKKDVANTMKHFLVILGTGIVTSEDESWMKQRLKMSMPLRRDVLQWIPTQTAKALQRLFDQTLDPACDSGRPVPVGSFLRHLTLQVISATFLSISADESDSTFASLYLPIVDESNQRVWHPYRAYLFVMPQFWIHLWNVRRLNQYVSHLIRQRWKQRQEFKRKQSQHAQQQQPKSQQQQQPLESERNHDILDLVLQVYETEFPHATVLPESAVKQFRDEMKTFMLAGHETSAAMMTWALYELMGNDTLRQQVIDEAQSVFCGQDDDGGSKHTRDGLHDVLTAEQLSHLVLSEACLKESLRKYSVVPIVARRTVHDLYLHDDEEEEEEENEEGKTDLNHQYTPQQPKRKPPPRQYFIPQGCSVMLNIQSIHMDPTLWPNPQKFDPYRFLLAPPNQDSEEPSQSKPQPQPQRPPAQPATIPPFTFVPFIAGPRNCLGQHLSLLESKMVISLLLKNYQFTLPPGVDIQVDNWKFGDNESDPRHRFVIPVIPKQELMVHVTKRESTTTTTTTTTNQNKESRL
ncbi:hypothetical protein ACA910_000714 [Epithemia clementina (nom. ined.)]